jgi:hypothetical protein
VHPPLSLSQALCAIFPFDYLPARRAAVKAFNLLQGCKSGRRIIESGVNAGWCLFD